MVEVLRQSINHFKIFFDKLFDEVGPPSLVNRSGFVQFRYSNENIKTLCLIKSARIISSLNAIVLLYQAGYFVEIGVIIRTIKECCADLAFLLENYPDEKLSKHQKQYLDDFFTENFEDPLNPIQSAIKRRRVPSKKIHAGWARTIYGLSTLIRNPKLRSKIQKFANPSVHQMNTLSILNTWSGYVHYGYPHSIEIVGGEPPVYHLEGMAGTPKVEEWQGTLITELFAIYNHFLFVCLRFNYETEFEFLSNKQAEFQALTGYDP